MEPQMDADESRLNEITERVIGCAYVVANTLGHGFLEKVYENALAHELRKAGLAVEQQRSIKIRYDGVVVGDYMADLLVEGAVLVDSRSAYCSISVLQKYSSGASSISYKSAFICVHLRLT
jgi:GxxExxY protein